MLSHQATAAVASLGCVLSASAQLAVPEFDVAKASIIATGDMELDDSSGSLDVSRFEIRSVLSKPLSLAGNLTVIPFIEYKSTDFDFDGVSAGFPINDEELHSINLSAFALSSAAGSPWFYGGYGRAEMATDFQDIGGDDFTFDLAGGVGYRFNDRFMMALGVAAVNLNGDAAIYPGIAFDWAVSDCFRVGLYGPTFVAAYSPDTNWEFSFRAENGGDVWNITDDAGKSRSIDLTSYRLGLFANRRLTGELWLTAGAGATVGNEISLTTPSGNELFEEDMDTGVFGQIGLRLRSW